MSIDTKDQTEGNAANGNNKPNKNVPSTPNLPNDASVATNASTSNSKARIQNPIGQLQHEGQAALLDAIDAMRARGLSKYVDLPRIIVCGDQSSGKSSVLEALSHIRFPVQDSLCTTFATEISIRRSRDANSGPSVTIEPGPSRTDPDVRARLQNFHMNYASMDDISNVIQEAKKFIANCDPDSTRTFSDDTLKIQVCNPDWPPLTIVDLPGIIHASPLPRKKAETGKGKHAAAEELEDQSEPFDDAAQVQQIVKDHMKEQRTIILAIVSAKNDIQNQVVLKYARELDRTGMRTLGGE